MIFRKVVKWFCSLSVWNVTWPVCLYFSSHSRWPQYIWPSANPSGGDWCGPDSKFWSKLIWDESRSVRGVGERCADCGVVLHFCPTNFSLISSQRGGPSWPDCGTNLRQLRERERERVGCHEAPGGSRSVLWWWSQWQDVRAGGSDEVWPAQGPCQHGPGHQILSPALARHRGADRPAVVPHSGRLHTVPPPAIQPQPAGPLRASLQGPQWSPPPPPPPSPQFLW